ncbi:MAG: RsmD family RNA methyltransferase [Brumimicrobium sp.]|nr:RsmD family RNA methyltransferase [Brumimicrobium sp.]
MRIISGKLKSYRFTPPKGFPSRPTTDFAKEALFNILENQFTLKNLEILDLFAGTGNISFEFASREAGNILAVDKNYNCIRFIREFAKKYELENELSALKEDAFTFLKRTSQKFDLIFADPPFDTKIHASLIEAIFESNVLNESALFIMEHDKHKNFSDHPFFESSRKYGHVVFSFFSKNP